MKREDLVKLGLTEDSVIDAIMAAHGKDIEKHKTDLTAAQTQLTTLQAQLTEASTTIEGFKKMDIDSIKKAADDYKTALETAQAESKNQIAALKFDHALDGTLTGAKAKNTKAVKALLDTSTLKFNDADGSIIGLKEQLEKVTKENPYLFDTGEEIQIVTGGNNHSVITDAMTSAARATAGLPVTPGK